MIVYKAAAIIVYVCKSDDQMLLVRQAENISWQLSLVVMRWSRST